MGGLLLAEWTKLRSVPRWTLAMLGAAVLTVVVSLLGVSSSGTDGNQGPAGPVGPDGLRVIDEFHFVHQPLSGDGSVTARVRTQAGIGADSHPWAKAGVMIKAGTAGGSSYAAMLVTPGHGVRLQSNFTGDRPGSAHTAPRWLRLTRSGTSVSGYESADGATWTRVGTVELPALPAAAEAGLFVASPTAVQIQRQFGSVGLGGSLTVSRATFDNVRVEAAQPRPQAPWRDQDVGRPLNPGQASQTAGTFTVTGSGDIVPNPPPDDPVRLSLTGVVVGLMAVVAVAVLFVTSEYKRGMIRTTFAASPRRGRVLAAKALVLGATTFVVGLVASLTAFLLAQPTLHANGFVPPTFPRQSLSDPPVLRAVVGTALLLAVIAVFSLGVGAILRRSAGAIAGVIVLLVVPQLLAGALPLGAAQWLMRLTPAAGFAIQQTVPRYDHVFSLCLPEDGCYLLAPWAGLGVLCAYTALTLAVAFWLVRRRDA